MLRKKIISISLALVLAVTLFPGLNFTATAAPLDLNREAVYTAAEGNIARLATVRQLTNTSETRYNPNTGAGVDRPGINANFNNDSYGVPSTQILRLTDGVRPGSATSSGYLSWSFSDSFGVSNRLYFILNWGQPFTIDAVRCEWWTDNNVSVPSNEAKIEWLDGTVWKEVSNMKNPVTGEAVTDIGTLGRGNWNPVTFDPVTTSQLRLKLHRTGTVSNGIGVGEWEVFGVAGVSELRSVSVTGNASPVVSSTNTYSAMVYDIGLEGFTYQWTAAGNVSIVGSATGSTVSVRADDVGAGTLTCSATLDGKTVTSSAFNINVQNISVSVAGATSSVVSTPNTYTATATAGTLDVAYEWSLDNANAVIIGSNTGRTVSVQGVAPGTARLTCKISSAGFEATNGINITFQNISVSVAGETLLPYNSEKVYTATAAAGSLDVAYAWSLNNTNAVIVGSATDRTVTVRGAAEGSARLTCTITNAAGGYTATNYLDINVKVQKALDYQGATAAGRAPILPRRVVVDGLLFDTPTPSVMNAAGTYDFAESYEASLVPVVWDMSSFTAADYAANKAGTTFEVTGTTTAGSRAPGLAVKAIFKVNEPMKEIDYNHSVTSENVIFDDIFWSPKQLINATTTFDQAVDMLESTSSSRYAVQNFKNSITRLERIWNGEAAGTVTHNGYVFQDSDVYKTLEGFAYTLAANWNDPSFAADRDRRLNKVKEWIELIETVQYADGYVNTNFTTRGMTHRWRNFGSHEMYVMGHFLESVVAYTHFTVGVGLNDYSLYEIGRRVADHIVNVFGPGGYRTEVPGHEEIELALMKFAPMCEEFEGAGAGQKYLDTVETLVDRRGRRTGEYTRESAYSGGTYSQDATPLVNETEAVGHAVRAMYFYTGATDIAIALPESNPNKTAFLNGINNIYNSVSETNMYITGGLGSGESSEGFGPPWHIRNQDAYTETCAAIAGANWYQRLNLYFEDAKYADAYERTLYNGMLVGITLQGNRFAYGTGLDGSTSRAEWQGCACCPPNVIRTIANIGGYMYTVNKDNVFVNLFGGSTGHINVQGDDVVIKQETQYPWEGAVKLTVTPPANKTFTLNLRLPGWVKAQKYQQVTLLIDGVKIDAAATDKGYIPITREWSAAGVVIDYNIPMEVRLTEGDANVTRVYSTASNRYPDSGQNDKVCVERGPIVYMVDSSGVPNGDPATATMGRLASSVRLPRDMDGFKVVNRLSGANMLLRGVYSIEGMARYNTTSGPRDQWIQLVPYYCKANRGGNPQNTANVTSSTTSDDARVWINATENDVLIRGDKYGVAIGETVSLAANPKVNISSYYTYLSGTGDNTLFTATGETLNYSWKILSGTDVIEPVGAPIATQTDDAGPGKIGGVNFTLDASVANYKAVAYGVATVQVDMKNAAGTTLATDIVYVEVFNDISVYDSISIVPESGISALVSTNEYSTGFTLVPKTNMQINMIIAEYNSRGALVNSEVRPLNLTANVSMFQALDIGSGNKTKVFFWDTNFVPLAYTFSG